MAEVDPVADAVALVLGIGGLPSAVPLLRQPELARTRIAAPTTTPQRRERAFEEEPFTMGEELHHGRPTSTSGARPWVRRSLGA